MSVIIACIVLIFCFLINVPIFLSVLIALLTYFFSAGDISPSLRYNALLGLGKM